MEIKEIKIITDNGEYIGATADGVNVDIDGSVVYVTGGDVGVRNVFITFENKIDVDVRILGDHWERGYGDLYWGAIDYERVMPWYFMIYDGEAVKGYGVKTRPNAFCSWKCNSYSITLNIDLRNGGMGTILGGRKLKACDIVTFESDKAPIVAAKDFCKVMCPDGVFPKEPVYGGNDWYCNYGNNSHEKIMNLAHRVAKWAEGNENRPFMVVDDGWEFGHNAQNGFIGGPWNMCNPNFKGMDVLAKEIKALDVRPGIWFRPLLTIEVLPDECINKRRPTDFLFLDPSHPMVLDKIKADVTTIKNWGYELIKHDFSTWDIFGRWGMDMNDEMTVPDWHLYDRSKTTAEVIKNMYAAIREAAGDVYIIGCNTVSHLAAGFFEIQRTGDDTSGKEWERTRKMGVNTLAFRMPQHNVFYASDADCVGVTNDVPWEKNKLWLELLAKSGTPLFVSVAAEADNEEIDKAMTEAFKYASKTLPEGNPLDWMSNKTPEKWELNGETIEFEW